MNRGGHQDRDSTRGRGRGQGAQQHHQRIQQETSQQTESGEQRKERPKKESIIDLSKFIDKEVRVKFQGGREATGKLKGYDHLLNLVLDDTIEYLRETETQAEGTRNLGLVVCRGPAVTVVCPQDGHQAIQNPFTEGC